MLDVGSQIARLRILDVVGAGGMGVVYRAHDDELDREVAVKVITPELAAEPSFRERFREEMRLAASLEHPHVCPVYHAGDLGGELFVVMRFVKGEDLGARIGREALAPAVAAALVTQLASALDHAHARGLSHRDVKPENVLLDEAGNAYLTDFGLAVDSGPVDDEGVVAGTLAYFAPERCTGGAAGPGSDQYALACLAYALLTGVPPFVREHDAALLYAHLREHPPSLAERGLSRLDSVLRRALEKDPDGRYPSCGAFAEELALALARTESSGPENWPESLPRPATRLIGRERELSHVTALLADPETKLLTLTGPGGTGKTRLAIQAAAVTSEGFPGGVLWIPLAPLRDPAHVLPAIAYSLEVGEQSGTTLADSLRARLAGEELLLVLDNAEHLLPAIATDVAHLRDIPGPTLLITSRARLDLQAEHLYPVPPLTERDGINLFNDRAHYLDPDHDPADPAIPELCERLDRLPLAIELAAARVPLYRPARLVEELSQHLDLLQGARDHDPRHSTLRATIDWSYELLAPSDQRVFRALSVFAGGCTLDAAVEVAAAEPDLLQSLIDKSLVRRRDTQLAARYWMLETIREYAHQKLVESDEAALVRGRHADRILTLAGLAEEGLRGPDARRWLDELDEESENLRTALAWLEETGQTEAQLTVVGQVRSFWYTRGRWSEGLRWAEAALVRSDRERSIPRATALRAAAVFATELGDPDAARVHGEESLSIFRELEDQRGVTWALKGLAIVTALAGDYAEARRLFEEAIGVASESRRPTHACDPDRRPRRARDEAR